MRQVRNSLDHAADFSGTKHDRQFSGNLGKDQVIERDVSPLECLFIEKPQRRHASFDCAGDKLLLPEQVEREPSNLITAEPFRRFSEVVRELFDSQNVAASGGSRVVTALKLVQHSLT
jgi:hypothetical protein